MSSDTPKITLELTQTQALGLLHMAEIGYGIFNPMNLKKTKHYALLKQRAKEAIEILETQYRTSF